MSNAIQNVSKISNGLCPHGMAPGACPICSGMGGGGRVGERPQKAGEMSYHQCAMIGAMMKARAERLETHEKNIQKHITETNAFTKQLEQISAKLSEFVSQISNNILLKPMAFVINNIVIPIFNIPKTISKIAAGLNHFIQQIQNKFIDIQDKLNTIFGEAKAFIDKKVSEIVSSIKTKFVEIFKIFKRNRTKDDDTKIDEDKKIFNLKKFIQKIWKKDKNDRKNNSRS